MKKTLVLLCIACLSLVSFAGKSVGPVAHLETDLYLYENGIFTIKKSGDLNITYYSPASKYGQVTEFGYYFEKEDPAAKGPATIQRFALDDALNGNETVTIKGLKEGDKFGLYFETQKNVTPTVYSEANKNTDYQHDQILFFNEDKGNKGYLFTFGDSKWQDGMVVGFLATYDAEELSGKPLPGVLTTLVIGGIAGYALKRKKKTASK